MTSLSAQRGTIYDRNGEILAMSGTVWTVYLSPVDIDSEEERSLIAKGLSEILDVSEEFVLEKSQRNTRDEMIKKKIERPLADEVTEFVNVRKTGLPAWGWRKITSDIIPMERWHQQSWDLPEAKIRALKTGSRLTYDSVLSGTNGQIVSAKNAWGTDMPFKYEKMYEAQNGNDLVLTIDVNIQRFVDKHLEQAVIEHEVQNKACAIVMDVKTGEILAMSTKPDFDPNSPNTIYDENVQAGTGRHHG